MKKVLRRILVLIPAIGVQLLWFWLLLRLLTPYAALLNIVLTILAAIVVLFILTGTEHDVYRTLWIIVILTLPVAGALLYLMVGSKRAARPLRKRLHKAAGEKLALSTPCDDAFTSAEPRLSQSFSLVSSRTGFPILPCEDVKYYPLGDNMLPDMLEAIRGAEKYVYIEYFIIEDGKMWSPMVDILEEKVHAGVDVRVMYDDIGSIATYSLRNMRALRARGLRCYCFNPVLYLDGSLNYRDHRKMLVVDGKIAFTGGVNLADEYINEKQRFGHWKDIGIRLTGAPALSYTRMFIGFWNAFANEDKLPLPASAPLPPQDIPETGLVLSYYDSPMYPEPVSHRLYVDLLGQATHTAWFYTPYLLLSDQMLSAFQDAAQRGVDVRILMPGIPDKKLVFRMSRSYYMPLLHSGVKIYEYTPGFLHAKGFVIDGKVAAVGTVNLDFRSLFFHFENNALFYRGTLPETIAADFLATQEKSKEILAPTHVSFFKRVFDGVLHLFSPLC